MRRVGLFVGLACIVMAATDSALAQVSERHILGIRLGTSSDETHHRLQKMGTLVRKEEPRQEAWEIRHPSFSHLIVGFNKENHVRYVTAVARTDKDARKITYDSIGDLKRARQAGDPKLSVFNYQWELPGKDSDPPTLVMAIGRDPKFLNTYSLKSLKDNPSKEKTD
jgi:hypothetical protein